MKFIDKNKKMRNNDLKQTLRGERVDRIICFNRRGLRVIQIAEGLAVI